MPKNKDQKTKLIEELKTNFNQAKGVAFVDYKGLSVKDVEELRKELRDNQITYVVAKKTLTNIALKE
ncbi:50S ribosomal protein L10, partial [Patescibacteria group bacterium]|nr:50S ribosomal protein L10 [Patescibacteria group bacterium]